MPLQATSGAASYDAFGGGKAAVPNYIEDVFSTYLYTGNGSTQTINNGIDLAGKGGLVWFKRRNSAVGHYLFDTARGVNKPISTQSTAAQDNSVTDCFNSFNADGFTLGSDPSGYINYNPGTEVSWTFRKQPKFFDVVTYTGNRANRTIAHNLGSVPGCIIVKSVSAGGNSWYVYHRSIDITGGKVLLLNDTNAALSNGDIFNSTLATSTEFTIGVDSAVNAAGVTNIAYLFAHNAGGFGLTGTDNVISCGSFTTDGSNNASVTLGYEPQWVLTKNTTNTSNWLMHDTMRGLPVGRAGNTLYANASNAENDFQQGLTVNATGFSTIVDTGYAASQTYIYIAIRRGPMKVPTTGTSVYSAQVASGGSLPRYVSGFPVDMVINGDPSNAADKLTASRLIGTQILATNTTAAEEGSGSYTFDYNNGYFSAGSPRVSWMFRRAPGFFDEVCYTGTGVARTVAHNLAAVPELMIVKSRSAAYFWTVYAAPLGNTQGLFLQGNSAASTRAEWNNTTPTSSVFSVGTSVFANESAATYVAYLFASCPGVSKVGSYTGTGTTQTINCGFTSGARFVLIKRTDTTGDWYVWDTARGIVAGNDPYLLLNSAAAEVTLTDFVDPVSTGFELSSTALATVNVSGGTYIFLAIA